MLGPRDWTGVRGGVISEDVCMDDGGGAENPEGMDDTALAA